ncbi:MAG: hypothetical protein ABIJ61_02940 [bacterium]
MSHGIKFLASAFLLAVCLQAVAEDNGLYLHIDIRKTEFIPYEPIWVFTRLENQGDRETKYTGSYISALRLFSDQQGRELACRITEWNNASRASLLPAQSSRVVAISLLSECTDRQRGSLVLEPGCYQIRSRFFQSDVLEFEVRGPSGEEFAASEFFGIDWAIYHRRLTDQAYNVFSEFVDRYPGSVLAPEALRRLIFLCRESSDFDPAIQRDYLCRLLVDYPQSPYVNRSLSPSFEIDWCDESRMGGVMDALDTVIATFAGTQIAERAQTLKDSLQTRE